MYCVSPFSSLSSSSSSAFFSFLLSSFFFFLFVVAGGEDEGGRVLGQRTCPCPQSRPLNFMTSSTSRCPLKATAATSFRSSASSSAGQQGLLENEPGRRHWRHDERGSPCSHATGRGCSPLRPRSSRHLFRPRLRRWSRRCPWAEICSVLHLLTALLPRPAGLALR